MNIYKIIRKDAADYHEYVGFIVVADGPAHAFQLILSHVAMQGVDPYLYWPIQSLDDVEVTVVESTVPHVVMGDFKAG